MKALHLVFDFEKKLCVFSKGGNSWQDLALLFDVLFPLTMPSRSFSLFIQKQEENGLWVYFNWQSLLPCQAEVLNEESVLLAYCLFLRESCPAQQHRITAKQIDFFFWKWLRKLMYQCLLLPWQHSFTWYYQMDHYQWWQTSGPREKRNLTLREPSARADLRYPFKQSHKLVITQSFCVTFHVATVLF